MSSMRTPVGPQPSTVYWRRRALVLLGVVIVVAVIVLIFLRPPADDIPPAAVGQSQDSAAQPAGAANSAAPAVCTGNEVTVTAITDANSYAEGVEPKLSWTLVNNSSSPCTLNVGTTQQVFTITSGDETIWKSSDCQTNAADFPLTVEPASSGAKPTVSDTVEWKRTRSDPSSCDSPSTTQVTAGGASYHLTVSIGGISSVDSEQFLLQ